jgi:glutaredoxin
MNKKKPVKPSGPTCGGEKVAPRAQNNDGPMYEVYGYMSCPYTAKQVTYMEENNIPFRFIDTKTETGSKRLEELTGGGTGVPVIVNTQTSQFKVGFTEI